MPANIVVTGGAGTLGHAVVEHLAGAGFNVAVIDMVASLKRTDSIFSFSGVDLADEEAVASAYATAAATLGPVDGVVNVAGGFIWEKIEEGSVYSWDAMYRINLRTALLSSRAALPHFSRRGGAIVNVGAAAASKADVGMGAYAASKAGVMALTESLAEELRGRRIRVNAVLPTILDTPRNREEITNADRSTWVSVEAAAKTIGFLVSEDSSAITGAGIKLSVGN